MYRICQNWSNIPFPARLELGERQTVANRFFGNVSNRKTPNAPGKPASIIERRDMTDGRRRSICALGTVRAGTLQVSQWLFKHQTHVTMVYQKLHSTPALTPGDACMRWTRTRSAVHGQYPLCRAPTGLRRGLTIVSRTTCWAMRSRRPQLSWRHRRCRRRTKKLNTTTLSHESKSLSILDLSIPPREDLVSYFPGKVKAVRGYPIFRPNDEFPQ